MVYDTRNYICVGVSKIESVIGRYIIRERRHWI